MSGLALDTSGAVDHVMVEGCVETGLEFEWADLDAFTQGYIEALFVRREALLKPGRAGIFAGFSDLAPEALAQIIADCAAALSTRLWGNSVGDGRLLWAERQSAFEGFADGDQRSSLRDHFPPLTPCLADDGKVHLREGAR